MRAWRDGGFTIHDISDAAHPKLLSHINWSPPFPGGTHTPLPLPGRKLAVVAEESNAEYCAKGLFYTWWSMCARRENPVPISTLPTPHGSRLLRGSAISARTICMRTGRARSRARKRSSPPITMPAACACSTSGISSQPKEIAYWVPPAPAKLIDPRPNVACAPMTCDLYVTPDGLMYVSDWNAGLHVLRI